MLRLLSTSVIVVLCLMPLAGLRAQDVSYDAPWEPEDITPFYMDDAPSAPFSPGRAIAESLIGFYQSDISVNSISRCPFHISCSNYALHAIREHGLLVGIMYFIDRNLYRENAASGVHYPLRETPSGALKLDDSFFLDGKGLE